MSRKLYSFVVVIVAAVLAALLVVAVQPLQSAYLTKAACTIGATVVLGAALWTSGKKAANRKAGILILVAILFVALSAETCGGEGDNGGKLEWQAQCEKEGKVVGTDSNGVYGCHGKGNLMKQAQDAVEQGKQAAQEQEKALKEKAKQDLQIQGGGYGSVQSAVGAAAGRPANYPSDCTGANERWDGTTKTCKPF
jgi:hypothetical protein